MSQSNNAGFAFWERATLVQFASQVECHAPQFERDPNTSDLFGDE
jgi:hypothetical protein